MKLRDKVVLVTGGSHGIGEATALACAHAGADVAITYRTRREGAESTQRRIEEMGRNAMVLQADVSRSEDCAHIVEATARQFGRIDVLVNNAGGARGGRLVDLDLEDWRYTLDLCVTAPFLLSVCVAKLMMAGGYGGAIVNISSVHSSHVWANRAAYGVAKAALNRLTKSMAVEWAQDGIRVNAVAPGYTNVAETEAERERYAATDATSAPWIVAQRTAQPSEIADVIVFLASSEASYVTGQTIFADGGVLLPAITTANYIQGDRSGSGFVG